MKKNNIKKTKVEKIAERNTKAALKAEQRQERKDAKLDPTVAAGFTAEKISKNKEKLKASSNKKPKEKSDFKSSFVEFPAKMLKDVSRIKWIPKGALGKRFLLVLGFLIFFAIAYEIVDQILLAVFKSINFI